MLKMDSFKDVIQAVYRHVDASGHHNIVLSDDPRAGLTGYFCEDCEPGTSSWWMAQARTIHALPEAVRRRLIPQRGRMEFIRELVKKALEPRPYRPTAWERILKA
jgi:hypothetical protein